VLFPARFGRVIGDGNGVVGGGSGRRDGDVGGDAALAGTRVLRPAAGTALAAEFDALVEGMCRPYYAPRMGAPSLPPWRYFRMHMIGYFEVIDSERGIARTRSRCAISRFGVLACACFRLVVWFATKPNRHYARQVGECGLDG
jgi:hypothetical protein